MPIPSLLHQRLSIDRGKRENRPPPPRPSSDHWLDHLEAGVKGHIRTMQQKRDELAAGARPPQLVLDAAQAAPEAVALGAGLNQAYTAALRRGKGQYANALERAKQAAEDYLAHFPPQRRGAILLGAIASVYGKDEGGADTAVWLAGNKS